MGHCCHSFHSSCILTVCTATLRVAFQKITLRNPVSEVCVFRPPICRCRVNERPNCNKGFMLLSCKQGLSFHVWCHGTQTLCGWLVLQHHCLDVITSQTFFQVIYLYLRFGSASLIFARQLPRIMVRGSILCCQPSGLDCEFRNISRFCSNKVKWLIDDFHELFGSLYPHVPPHNPTSRLCPAIVLLSLCIAWIFCVRCVLHPRAIIIRKH